MNKISDLFTKYSCTNCQDDINGIRVHCAECENFDLCLQCFATGAEIGTHQNNHAYQFMDTGTAVLSVYRGKGAWTAREEIRLLDAVEKYGYGNWEDVSKHIETKSPEDSKEEYANKFVKGTMGRHTWIPAQAQRPKLVDHTTDDTGPLGETTVQRIPPLDISNEEAAQLGYMPNRDSFEREYDPAAEQLISSISLSSDDSEADYLLKLAHVDMYTRRRRERVRRKRLVRDYQLVTNFFRNRNYALHPRLTREQKDFRDRFRVFAQFYTCNEYDRLLASLEREKELRIRLSELFRYRYNGLTKIEDCRHFEQHVAVTSRRPAGPSGHAKTLPCIIGIPNGNRLNGCYRQCLTVGQHHTQHWKSSAARLFRTISSVQQQQQQQKGRPGKRKRKLKFHRTKKHAPHRRPDLLRRIIAQQKLFG
ncbi:transcriptional adapter 2B-like isoform X3 [Teleopsis dalmanni]|uniref:transcriptional adapter 2B-like isoform X3 n=1 Tax=Teleopsis dalmanni TaxID=139649 RepID=UPI0018CCD0DD|nr:transcriptional adapter 2B-like isoform X3 [Teleopsis dalmanni]XP_037949475.1 transcriptional adapter 2B-like isoform X3 [Teleopsis dalmanni]XP_037949694.1 transcriptional adapter 2B-like isoform X3 [Teleopsis dalmanni]